MSRAPIIVAVTVLVALTACDADPSAVDASAADVGPPAVAVFSADVEASWTELRDCRHSHEHELNHIRVFANDLAREP